MCFWIENRPAMVGLIDHAPHQVAVETLDPLNCFERHRLARERIPELFLRDFRRR
jgi:hypothetical protein